MEKLNDENKELRLNYKIYKNEINYDISYIVFFLVEKKNYGLEKKIEDLGIVISKLLIKLEKSTIKDKLNIIEILKGKQDVIKNLGIQFKEIVGKFIESFDYYSSIIKDYKKKTGHLMRSFGKNKEKKQFLDIGIDLQLTIKDYFFDFYEKYKILKNSYLDNYKYITDLAKKYFFYNK